ncbi:DUF397 domain-containing protein [Streptomyces sp. NPDC052309]|uniref:DUF397 domain-containing protein n=1 Tax=Streptomyces sp. NPDC052309 TaxID=3155421 RepID=UPI0034429A4C
MNSTPSSAEPSHAWFRSSYSNGAGGECVECAAAGDRILLRDSKAGDQRIASVGTRAWHVFAHAVRRGWPETR